MKKTQEIIGLPVISISGGMEIGRVKGIIINADEGAVDYVIIDSGAQSLITRIISADSITGIGEYALTIESEDDVKDINQVPGAVELLNKDVKIIGTKVITKKGRLIGEVIEFYIDEDNCCKITGMEYSDNKSNEKVFVAPRSSVITFGKELAIVEDNIENELLESTSQLTSENGMPEISEKEFISLDEDTNGSGYLMDGSTGEFPGISDAAAAAEDDGPEPDTRQEESTASLFEQRQKQYLTGRKATKPITDNDGNIIINDGELITGEIIDEAKKAGKLIELVMNNKA